MSARIKNVLEFLENSAEKYPDKIAFADETTAITYSDFVHSAKSLATAVARIAPQCSPVAVLGQKSVGVLTAFFACVYAGCFYVPLNPAHPSERRERIIKTLGDPAVLVAGDCRDGLPQGVSPERVIFIEDAVLGDDFSVLDARRREAIDTDPLYVLFTSGSTGEPKGIAVSHRSVIDFIEEFTYLFGIDERDVIANQAPFDFDVSVKDIYSTIKAGATMHVVPKQKFSFPTILLDYLCERKVTTLIWAVSALCILSGYRAFSYKVPDSVQKILFSGEAMPLKHLRYWKKYFPEARFVNLYGPTEITCNCTYYALEKGPYEQEVLPIGKPFPNERVFLLDEENKPVTAPNIPGEICVTGTALGLGYYNAPEETARAFTASPLVSAYPQTTYRTGDMGYYAENGDLCFIGRKDFQIKHLGHRIELREIETAMERCGGVVRTVCLYDAPHSKIYAYYQGDAEDAAIAAALREKLPAYMVPNRFVRVEKFPLTENGKVDRKKLKEETGL